MPRRFVGKSGVVHYDLTEDELDKLVDTLWREAVALAPKFWDKRKSGLDTKNAVREIQGEILALAYRYVGRFNEFETELFRDYWRDAIDEYAEN